MVDITKYPYFSYNTIINHLLEPITSKANILNLAYKRWYPCFKQFAIITSKEWAIDYYGKEFYRYGLFEKNPTLYKSSYNMWDHLECDPNGIYDYFNQKLSFAHGLTIVKQHGDYCDVFVFTTTKKDSRINNFYINHIDLFEEYIQQFYCTLDPVFTRLSKHTITIPGNTNYTETVIKPLSLRQQDCVALLYQGLTSKEIAKTLNLSPRTIEEHINILKKRYKAKNRTQLLALLQRFI